MGAPERFEDGGESKKTSESRSYAVPATVAAGLAGVAYTAYRWRQSNARVSPETGERAWETLRQWTSVNPMEAHRPPEIDLNSNPRTTDRGGPMTLAQRLYENYQVNFGPNPERSWMSEFNQDYRHGDTRFMRVGAEIHRLLGVNANYGTLQ